MSDYAKEMTVIMDSALQMAEIHHEEGYFIEECDLLDFIESAWVFNRDDNPVDFLVDFLVIALESDIQRLNLEL